MLSSRVLLAGVALALVGTLAACGGESSTPGKPTNGPGTQAASSPSTTAAETAPSGGARSAYVEESGCPAHIETSLPPWLKDVALADPQQLARDAGFEMQTDNVPACGVTFINDYAGSEYFGHPGFLVFWPGPGNDERYEALNAVFEAGGYSVVEEEEKEPGAGRWLSSDEAWGLFVRNVEADANDFYNMLFDGAAVVAIQGVDLRNSDG